MKHVRFAKLYRVIFALMLLAGLVLAVPGQAQAASPFIAIVSVKAGESVTIHASGLPAGKTFTARMDKGTTTAADGTVVGQTVSDADGTFDATYAIPAALKTELPIAIRIDAEGGYYAYNWFLNQTKTASPTPATTATPATTTTPALKPFIAIIAVEKNSRITASAANFPANVDFQVRVGPYATYGRDQQAIIKINSGKGGSFLFNVTLPAVVKDVSLVTVRLDSITGSQHYYAYNVFTNENKGTVVPNPTQPTPTPTPSNQASCQILSVSPTQSMAVNTDFDAVWEVKNTGAKAWDNHEIDLRYQSGDKFYKFNGLYDLPRLVQPGETIKLVADMLAPAKAGAYSTTFILIGEHGVVCSLPLTITVR